MDPYEAWRLMQNATTDSIDRQEAAIGLASWLERGGFWDPAVLGISRAEAEEEAGRIAMACLMDEDQ